jgi:hypothetical protein
MRRSKSPPSIATPGSPTVDKLSWEETAREMAASREDWSAWDAAAADGLGDLQWQADRKGQTQTSGE